MIHAAFIGLGNMGYPMAGHLANAGHAVTVYSIPASRRKPRPWRPWTRIWCSSAWATTTTCAR